MAVNIDVSQIKNITEYPNTFKRQGAFSLEEFEVFNSLTAAQTYAASNPVAYIGQKIVVVETDESGAITVSHYSINDAEGTLVPLGSKVEGDDVTITIADGIAKLYGAANAKAGQQPRIGTDGKLEWYDPDTSTVSGLADTVAGHTTDIKNLQDNKANKATTLEGYGITDAYTKTETATAISEAILKSGHASFKKVDAIPSVEEAADNVLYLVMNSTTNHYDIYAKVGTEVVLLDDTTVSLDGYVQQAGMETYVADAIKNKVDKVEGKGLSTKDFTENYETKLTGIAAGAEKNVINSITVNGSAVTVDESTRTAAITIDVPEADTALTNEEIDNAIDGK